MSTAAQTSLREKVGETGPASPWDDDALQTKLDEAEGQVNLAAALIWEVKAGGYAKLVNSSEGAAISNLGDLYKNALAMADRYRNLAAGDSTPGDSGSGAGTVDRGSARVGRIVRA